MALQRRLRSSSARRAAASWSRRRSAAARAAARVQDFSVTIKRVHRARPIAVAAAAYPADGEAKSPYDDLIAHSDSIHLYGATRARQIAEEAAALRASAKARQSAETSAEVRAWAARSLTGGAGQVYRYMKRADDTSYDLYPQGSRYQRQPNTSPSFANIEQDLMATPLMTSSGLRPASGT